MIKPNLADSSGIINTPVTHSWKIRKIVNLKRLGVSKAYMSFTDELLLTYIY